LSGKKADAGFATAGSNPNHLWRQTYAVKNGKLLPLGAALNVA
jgi:hypothetical protein